jgi:hypothetical protein
MARRGVIALWVLAVMVNLALVATLLWLGVRQPRPYGEPSTSNALGFAVLSILPLVNLAALGVARKRSAAARSFARAVSWANRGGAALGILFGLASCLELTYSPMEVVATIFLVVPPAVTAVALWASTRTTGVSSVA